MKRYPVAMVREHFAEALNAADEGVPVVIERRGVRYRLTRERSSGAASVAARARIFSHVDSAILGSGWSWTWTPSGTRFTPRRQK